MLNLSMPQCEFFLSGVDIRGISVLLPGLKLFSAGL